MIRRAVCGESRTHGSEGAEGSRGPSATLQQGLPKPRVGGSIPPRRVQNGCQFSEEEWSIKRECSESMTRYLKTDNLQPLKPIIETILMS